MGVADMVSVSTLTFIWRRRSLTDTPNFCSSSMMSRPRSELDGFPDEFMRADEDVDVALGEIFEQGFGLRRGTGSGEIVDTDGEVLQPLGEGLVMLERQDGGGHHDGDLLAVGGGFEGGANGDFGFAEADIATYQTIHGARLLHVGFHLTRDAQLVGRVLIGE